MRKLSNIIKHQNVWANTGKVKGFDYLGCFVSQDGSSTKEIKPKTGLATVCGKAAPSSFLGRSGLINKWNSSLYGCESWTLTADTEQNTGEKYLKLTWYGHITRYFSMSKTFSWGKVFFF